MEDRKQDIKSFIDRHAVLRFARNWWSWVLLLVVVFFAYNRVSPNIDLSTPDGQAPDFTLESLDGDSFTLSEHRGEVIVLNFWATWCPPCRAEIPGFIDLQEEMRDRGIRFVGVSLDEDGFASVRPYAMDRGINYTLVADRGRVAGLYGGIGTVPTTFIIDREGNVRYRHTGLLLKGALKSALDELTEDNT